MDCGAAATANVRNDVLERTTEFHVKDGVEDRIEGGVGVAKPEQKRVQPMRKFGEQLTVSVDAAGEVEREEAEPHGTEDADDGRHANCCSHFAAFAAVTLTRRTRRMLSLPRC